MSGIEAKAEGNAIAVTIEIGDKRARLRVKPEYALALAHELIDAVAQAGGADAVALRKFAERFDRNANIRKVIEQALGGRGMGGFWP